MAPLSKVNSLLSVWNLHLVVITCEGSRRVIIDVAVLVKEKKKTSKTKEKESKVRLKFPPKIKCKYKK